ncbi:MAG: hypothetical protein Q9159_004917 [Coniocarpon cinnabarinum]
MVQLHPSSLLTFILLGPYAIPLEAQFPGGGSGFGSPFGGSSNGGSSSSPSNGGDGAGFGSSGAAGGSQYADQLLGHSHVVAHGVMAALALVIFFPFGAISIRVIPSKIALYGHAAFQVLGYLLFIVAFGLGVWMARQMNFPGFSLLHQAHPIIGIVVFAFLSLQPILGVLHHIFFKKYSKRTVWSHAHLWIGRIFITLGIINGGLGLKLARNASTGQTAAYGVIAGVVWLVWLGAAMFGEWRKLRSHRLPEYERYPQASEAVKVPGGGPGYYA